MLGKPYGSGSGKIRRVMSFLKMRHPSAVEPSLASPNRSVGDGDKAERNPSVDHAGEHFGLDFKRLAVEMKLVNGVPAKGPIARANIGRGGAKQSGGNPGQQVVANEVESRHGVGFDSAVQTVADHHFLRIEAAQEANHFPRCVGAIGVQHDHGIGFQFHRLAKAMPNGTALARVVLVNNHHTVLGGHLGCVVRAVAVHHQHRGAVAVALEASVRDAVQHPCQAKCFVEHWEQDDEVLHGPGLLPLHMVFAVHSSVIHVNQWNFTPVRSNKTVSCPTSRAGSASGPVHHGPTQFAPR